MQVEAGDFTVVGDFMVAVATTTTITAFTWAPRSCGGDTVGAARTTGRPERGAGSS